MTGSGWQAGRRILVFQRSVHPPYLHSFPTRRSSDLLDALQAKIEGLEKLAALEKRHADLDAWADQRRKSEAAEEARTAAQRAKVRSEEHTSELQSRRDLVCRLLLEKKNLWPGA